jgi:hypothetical protein
MGEDNRETQLTGGCQCGAVRYAVFATPTHPSVCHCRMCQKAGGGPFMAFAGVRDEQFEFTRGAATIFRSSDIAERGFCGACGTPLTYRLRGSRRTSFTIGSLDRPEAVSPAEQIGVESMSPWMKTLHALPARPTQDWLDAVGIQSVGDRQHPDHETQPS